MEKSFKDHIYINILCGGGGTRLWPRSRKKTPKQFINLFGKKTLFQTCVEHSLWLTSPDKIFVMTNYDYVDEALAQGKVISPRNIIAEPEAKNTAMAMGVAACYIKKRNEKAIIINFPSDHLIKEKKKFSNALFLAAQAASSGEFILTLGIKPTFPHTGLGYIEAKRAWQKFSLGRVYEVASFREKPELATAKKFIESGNFYWNSGIYIWQVSTILSAFEKYQPSMAVLLKRLEEAIGGKNEQKVLEEVYRKAENISIDYAISEKAKNLLLVPAAFYWNDVGDWKMIYNLSKKDRNRNVFISYGKKGDWQEVKTKNCLIQAGERLVGTVGVENLVIIETPEALLIAGKDKVQEVKTLVNLLKKEGKDKYL